MIPKTTDPLTKFIRTGEGILVFAFNIALLVVPIVSNALTASQSAKWATIIDGIAVVSRTGLKIVAAVRTATGVQAQALAAPQMNAEVASGAVGIPVAGAGAPPAAQLSGAPPSPSVTPGVDIASLGQMVSDAEEFADAPTLAESQPSQPPPASPSPPAGVQAQLALVASRPPQLVGSGPPQLVGSGPPQLVGGRAAQPGPRFLTRLGG